MHLECTVYSFNPSPCVISAKNTIVVHPLRHRAIAAARHKPIFPQAQWLINCTNMFKYIIGVSRKVSIFKIPAYYKCILAFNRIHQYLTSLHAWKYIFQTFRPPAVANKYIIYCIIIIITITSVGSRFAIHEPCDQLIASLELVMKCFSPYNINFDQICFIVH